MPIRIRECYMNVTRNYPVWEWERRGRPRDGGGVCGRTCRSVYNNLSKTDRSLEGLIWDKNGQKPAPGKNSFILRAAQQPDGIRPPGIALTADPRLSTAIPRAGIAAPGTRGRDRAGRRTRSLAVRIAGARNEIHPIGERGDAKASPGSGAAVRATDRPLPAKAPPSRRPGEASPARCRGTTETTLCRMRRFVRIGAGETRKDFGNGVRAPVVQVATPWLARRSNVRPFVSGWGIYPHSRSISSRYAGSW